MSSSMSGAEFTINAAGVEFNALESGRGSDAIFLHGFSGDLHTWDSLIPALDCNTPAFERRMLRYDLRGFGKSFCESQERFSHAEDLLAIADARGLDTFDLIGLSMGGATALNFALNHPERVRKLVLISPGMVAWEWSDAWVGLWQAIVEAARTETVSKARELWWRHPLFETTRDSVGAQALRDSIMNYSGSQWLRDFQRREMPDVERLHNLKTPTLLLSGAKDVADFLMIADVLTASIPDIKRIDFSDAGHLIQLESPGACAASIANFL